MDQGDARRALRTMWRIRCFEERVAQLKRSLLVHGLIHLSIGGEGVAAAVCGQLEARDALYSGHRAHGHALAKGAPMNELMAELMGRETGLCKGLGGSMHLVDAEHGLMGATGVVGGNIPLALGHALANRINHADAISVVCFGDGAVQAGHFAESVNLAALWRLPVIFVCENNGLAEFTSRAEHSPVERVADVIAPYGFARETLDGSDVPAVHDQFREFAQGARAGTGPFLLECLTYRGRGHYEGDAQAYRDPAQEAEWERRDPIARLTTRATEQGWLRGEEAAALEREAREEVERAVEFARDSPFPASDLPARLVYA